MNITEKEVIMLASAMVQGIFSNPNSGPAGDEILDQPSLKKEKQIALIGDSVLQCRIALLKAGYTIYPITVKS